MRTPIPSVNRVHAMTALIPRSFRQFFAAFVVGLSFIARGFRD